MPAALRMPSMASSVAAPLEKQFSLISGLDSMTSSSGQGQTRITLQFRLDRNIDAAFQDVQAAVSAATRALPRDMPSPPSLRKSNPAEGSILFLNVSSKTLPLSLSIMCRRSAERQIPPRRRRGGADFSVMRCLPFAFRSSQCRLCAASALTSSHRHPHAIHFGHRQWMG